MSTYEDEFPKVGGPYDIPNYTAKETLDRLEPAILVELDWGAFRRLWEILEAEAKRHFPTRASMSTARAELRAVSSFRKAWRHQAGPIIDTTSTESQKPAEAPARRFKKTSESQPEPAPEAPARRKLNRHT